MRKNWIIKQPDIEIVSLLEKELGISKVLCQILAHRGAKTKEDIGRFLKADITDLYDPFSLTDMEKAVSRIRKAILDKENILIFSDYDVDGITSCAIMEMELKRLGAVVSHYIPHRVKEGYGLNANAVKLAHKQKIKLLIALDCGIRSIKEVDALNKFNIDTVIVDHHNPEPGKLPKAYAIVDPQREDCPYKFKHLAAVGLVYKLICALNGEIVERYLDLVALGTVADVVPLIDENRIIVKNGLKLINNPSNFGVKALIEASGLIGKEINPGRISFILAPRINASGRVDSAEVALDLLLSDNTEKAKELAGSLNVHNRSRQKIEEGVMDEALNLIEKNINFKEHQIIVLAKEDWHPGVSGIVASKIADRFFRPTIIISLKDGLGKGSGRSIPGFHLFNAVSDCSSYLAEFGGHSHAVGLVIEERNIADFTSGINKIAKENITVETLRPVLEIDAQLPLMFLNHDLIDNIKKLEPFGLGNPRPLFCSHDLTVKTIPALLGRDTIKFWVTDGERTFEAIGFGLKEMASYIKPPNKIDIAYHLTLDNWQNVNSLLLEIKDLRLSQ